MTGTHQKYMAMPCASALSQALIYSHSGVKPAYRMALGVALYRTLAAHWPLMHICATHGYNYKLRAQRRDRAHTHTARRMYDNASRLTR